MIGLRLIGLTDLAAIGLGLVGALHGSGTVGLGVHRLDQQSVAQIKDLRVRHIRYTLYWSHWNDPAYRLQWERDLQRALQAGLDPLVVVHEPPFGDFQHRDLVYQAFARFMEERAAQFPAVRAWQLWNEMDDAFTDVFGAGHPEISFRQRGQLYAQMLRLAYPAIKRGNPNALVVTGGIASPIEGGFLQGLYDSNAPYDVLAIHTYGYPLALAFDERGRSARRVMTAHRDRRPLWNTEFGLERAVIPVTPGLLPAEVDRAQLEAWKSCIEANDRSPVYGRIYGHVLTEGNDLGFGLIRADGSARPAYRWLKSWMRSH
ncbi:MAG: hypothetical protein QOH59_2597 [Gemmatimonadales bacterium]|nr:hypothetical protein [Gemmatimonadales bacterium]